jgi:hypothetical protein
LDTLLIDDAPKAKNNKKKEGKRECVCVWKRQARDDVKGTDWIEFAIIDSSAGRGRGRGAVRGRGRGGRGRR